MDIYKSLSISIGTVMKNPVMLKCVSEMCKHAVKKLPYLFRYVPDQYKTQKTCDKAVLENGGTLTSIPDCYKNQEMCNNRVDNYPHALEFVPDCFMTQDMCDKAVNRCFFVFDSIPNQYKTQKMCGRVVSEVPFLIVYCSDKYKTQRMCDEAVDNSLAGLKLIPDYFVTSKMIKKLFTALHADENILYFTEDTGNGVCSCNEMGIVNIELNNINFDNNF